MENVIIRSGLDVAEGRLDLISNVIRRMLNIKCAVLMGANTAPEVSIECFCEATIGVYNIIIHGVPIQVMPEFLIH